jgi:hypothetical protein
MTDVSQVARERAEMLGVTLDGLEKAFAYWIARSLREAADYCNLSGAEYFPPDAEFYLADYALANFMLDKGEYSPRWEKMRRDAEQGLLRFRRVRW